MSKSKKFFPTILLITVLFFFFSCGRDDKNVSIENEEENDTVFVTPAESFAITLVDDILAETDEDLTSYLENEIYPIVSKSEKVTIDKISSTLFILTYLDEGTEKSFLIEKSYNPVRDEITFTKKETNLNSYKIFLNIEK